MLSRRSFWLTYLILGGLAVLAFSALPEASIHQQSVYHLIALSSVITIIVGAQRHRPDKARIWYMFAIVQAMLMTGDLILGYYTHVQHISPPFPSLANALYIGVYPVLIWALVSFTKSRLPGKDMGSFVDSSIIAIGAGLLSWVFIIRPYLSDDSLTTFQQGISVTMPVLDILLLALLARLFVSAGARPASFYILGLSLLMLFAGNNIYAYTTLTGHSELTLGGAIAWLASYVLWGAAALHPSMVELTKASASPTRSFSRGRLAWLAGASLIAPAILALQTALNKPADAMVIAGASGILFVLVIERMAGLIRDVRAKVDALDTQGTILRKALGDREALEGQLRHRAFHDALTNLPNRTLFADRVDQSLTLRVRSPQGVAVLFLDLDEFKMVNDALGHEAGDELLQQVAKRLKGCLRASDTPARLGGDEFAVLLTGMTDASDATIVADGIVQAMQLPFAVQNNMLTVNVSVGIALAHDGDTSQDLLRNADVAMYMAKKRGKNCHVAYEAAMHSMVLDRAELKNELSSALAKRQFRVFYQTIVELPSGRVAGVEALVRWQHPKRGLVPPLEFLPHAEESGQIAEIDKWVLAEACMQLAQWKRELPGRSPIWMSVNLSGRSVQNGQLVSWVQAALDATGLEPRDLVIEITEHVLVSDLDKAVQRLTELKRLGVSLAVDDFGTGYSSLNYLKRFPVDILKIDKSFVDGVAKGPEESALARAILSLAETLNLETIAEGIEDVDQASELSRLGAALGQGYLFSKPTESSVIYELIRAGLAEAAERRPSEATLTLTS